MRQKINLNGEGAGEKTIYWEDVNIEDGVYAKPKSGALQICFFAKCIADNSIKSCGVTDRYSEVYYPDLKATISGFVCHDFYTLSGQRIVTEKELTVDDLKDTDHVGFVTYNGYKSYFIAIDDQKMMVPVCIREGQTVCNTYWGLPSTNTGGISEAIRLAGSISEMYRFDTRKELYQWLAED